MTTTEGMNTPRDDRKTVWVVRAGKLGEDEDFVLENGLAMIGFTDIDVPIPNDRAACKELATRAWPKEKKIIESYAGQLLRFAHEIREGDIVVLPRKKPGASGLAAGIVRGPYELREIEGRPRHARRVEWVRKDIAYETAELKPPQPQQTVFRIHELEMRNRIVALVDPPIDLNSVDPPLDLKSAEGLRRACEAAAERLDGDRARSLAAFLEEVRDATGEERSSEGFQQRIWADSLVWKGGSSPREINRAIEAHDFRAWLAERSLEPLPADPEVRAQALESLLKDLRDRIRTANRGDWAPWVEPLRTLAILFPADFTGVARREKLFALLRAMGLKAGGPVTAHRRILDRLGEVLGPVEPSDFEGTARRMLLAVVLRKLRPDEPRPVPKSGVDLPALGELLESFHDASEKERLLFPDRLVESLHLGLWAHRRRHFAVLSGLSGTGKTQLAVQYALALTGAAGETDGPVEVIAVQPGWYDPGPLLGYINPLDGGYHRTECLEFLLRAHENPTEPHVLILDEMNLSHPEQYIAPILSAMERDGGEIMLHRGDATELGVPTGIPYPANLVLIGTVNMDETTMGISDKVLDRAFTLEFWEVDPDEWPGWDGCLLGETGKLRLRKLLKDLMRALGPARRHFGWRVIAEVAGYLERREREEAIGITETAALDEVIYARVLPKLRGDDTRRFRKCLEDCHKVLEGENLARCARKVRELRDDLEATGSATFWR